MDALFGDYLAIKKSGLFDAEYYLATYPDVAERNIDPLVHYLEEGARQGRNPHPDFDSAFYLEQCRLKGERPVNPLIHYIRIGAARGFAKQRDEPGAAISAAGDGRAPILVALESLGVVGAPDRSPRLSAGGWALAAAPISEIALSLNGELLGTAAYGLPRPDVARLYPDRAAAGRSGFILSIDLPREASGVIEPVLTVRTADGEIGRRPLRVEIGPEKATATIAEAREGAPDAPGGTARSTAAEYDDAERKLHLDAPKLIDGSAATPVRGSLEIAGWALARAGVAAIEIAVDNMPMAFADYSLRRQDVQAAFPDWDNALGSGYQALLPRRALLDGSHTVTITMRDRAGKAASIAFRIAVEEAPEDAGPWSLRRKMAPAEIDLNLRILARCGCRPSFAAILPVAGEAAALHRARATIASLCAQAYPDWRLLIVARRAAKAARLRQKLLAGFEAIGDRVAVLRELAPGDLVGLGSAAFVTLLAAGDELGCDAFLEMAVAAALNRDADFLYSDERCRNPATGKVEAYFKPQWSPDLLLSSNYIGRVWCARAELLQSVAAAEPLLGWGEYDLILRCTEAAKAIRHVAAVLCERATKGADSAARSKLALERMLVRRGIAGEAADGIAPGSFRIKRRLTQPGLVSIIIPTCAANGLIEKCLTTLREVTAYRDFEIICIENIAPKDRKWRAWLRRNADRVIAAKEPFNWARFNNLAAAEARGRYLLFLNDDIEIVDPGWLEALLAEAQRPEIGVVGPLLLYPDRRIQHAGMFLAAMGQARHAFRYAAEDDPGYFGLALTQRNVMTVTGACFLARRDIFDRLGGFDEAHGIIHNDTDFCLRVWQSGLFTVYTPHAKLIHHEKVSRGALDDEYDTAAFDRKWRHVFVAGDPFFNPHLSRGHDGYAFDDEPTELSVTGGPALLGETIRNILVVKLDHIGDCITAFPAVRRLKRHFPQARIAVLTSRASKPVWAFEPAVDAVIEFDFFHARSGLGELEHSAEEWAALQARLAGERFDLAVDLRKHIETRPVLQHAGARYRAGFDHRHQFPWLDVALEWGGDHMLARKRQWAGDDLVNLVDAIAAACEGDRAVIAIPPEAAQPEPAAAPVVWVHPTAGNDIKQWPVEYFAAVIDRLVETHGARIFLTGAPGDEAIAEGIVRLVHNPAAVTSMIGRSPLAELPALLRGAALFLGNDSGVKHIAAGLGVPTVAVHGGTLDPREWGAVGPSAVALARDMVCSPCYLSKAEDCRRNIACLRQLDPGPVYQACRRLLLLNAALPAAPAPA